MITALACLSDRLESVDSTINFCYSADVDGNETGQNIICAAAAGNFPGMAGHVVWSVWGEFIRATCGQKMLRYGLFEMRQPGLLQ